MKETDVYESVKQWIVEGDLEPGQRLTEEFLSTTLGISRTPVREAMKRLEADGLVTPVKRRGVVVRSFTAEDVQQIYDIRALLEGYAAGHAARFRTDAQIEQMAEAVSVYDRCLRLPTERRQHIHDLMQANNAFHETLHAAAHNPHLNFMIGKVVVLPLVFRSFYWYSAEETAKSNEDHKRILHAVVLGDADWARSEMLAHIYRGRDHVLAHAADLAARAGDSNEVGRSSAQL
ncbi:MAG: GntR family transcriptional regulator [Alicyclobacillus sp.]|nr:GntR family transcriptional regulator [Alicyclobacillus sp.]